ncbi:MAG: hypothetical protein V3R21_08800, partial [Woeseiaceae bacterium]
ISFVCKIGSDISCKGAFATASLGIHDHYVPHFCPRREFEALEVCTAESISAAPPAVFLFM